jgi:hypothetical protein
MLTTRERNQIQKAITQLQKLLDSLPEGPQPKTRVGKESSTRTRRTPKDVNAFRRQIKAAFKQGVPAARLAEANGVTTSYIYQIIRAS